ncbi:MAG: transglutaminase N-terminal domain-containing protein [Lautropia sp.]
MRYRVLLRSYYRYSAPVQFARHALRLLPHATPVQSVRHDSLKTVPVPYRRSERSDFFGNRVVQLALERPHSRFAIEMNAEVDVASRGIPDTDRSPPWERIAAAAVESRDAGPLGPAHYLHPGPHTDADDDLVAFARSLLSPQRPILAAAFDIACTIRREMAYAPGTTAVDTTAAAAWRLRQGVCQDFSHLMLATLRAVGLPAAYVSGLLRTRPPPGEPRLEGADAMHAWVSVWAGEALGWVDIDPTNALLVDDDHIRIAVGREYADVAPIDGVIVVAGEQQHGIAVDVVPLDEAA